MTDIKQPEKDTALAVIHSAPPEVLLPSDNFLPALSLDEAQTRYQMLITFVKGQMREDIDYGAIPGTGDKRTLLKPGAEKLCTLFGLSVRMRVLEKIEDWTGQQHDGEPFFSYTYACDLFRGNLLMATTDANCNSWERKYRYRAGHIRCPECGQAAVFKSKRPGEGFYCWSKKNGCGMQFAATDERITKQDTSRTPNPDICDQVNTIMKMAQKRALVGSTIIAANASEFFTQDLDDLQHETTARQPEVDSLDSRNDDQLINSQPATINTPEGKRKAALRLVASGAISFEETQRRYYVGKEYVFQDEQKVTRCSCEEYAEDFQDCPHIIAVKLYTQAQRSAPSDEPHIVTSLPDNPSRWKCTAETMRHFIAVWEKIVKHELGETDEALRELCREQFKNDPEALDEQRAAQAVQSLENYLATLDQQLANRQTAPQTTTARGQQR
jgi:hypothetical protein